MQNYLFVAASQLGGQAMNQSLYVRTGHCTLQLQSDTMDSVKKVLSMSFSLKMINKTITL